MDMARPTGEYVERMLTPDGWPGVDENTHYDRAQQYTQVLQQVNEVLGNCRHEQCEVFAGSIWSGNAAGAANNELEADVAELVALQNSLATAITWHRYIAMSIVGAKSGITDIVNEAREQITRLQSAPQRSEAERSAAIEEVVTSAHGANARVVTATAEQILASRTWEPPDNALQQLLKQKATPGPSESAPGDAESPDSAPVEDGKGGSWQEDSPPTPVVPQPPVPGPNAGGVPVSIPGGSRLPPASPVSPTRAAVAPAPAVPAAATAARGPAPRSVGDDGQVAAPPADAPSPGGEPPDSSPRMSPASATGMPVMPMAPGAAGGAVGAAPVTGSGGSAGAGWGAPGAGIAPGRRPATIPTSPARRERDAIAEAATADASRRAGADQLHVARRIAAALNATVSDLAPGFYWVTALTTDGAIVVANSYGLAYIPEGVWLPEQVRMASADPAIPAAERASWATYPMLAVRGWATHHGAELRAVIATAEQFADTDPGAARIVLQPEDIPDSGDMIGRSRLEVVDPEVAEQLAATPEGRLTTLLPVPADPNPPADERVKLWMRVVRTVGSSASGRGTAHLRAFHTYAAHSQQAILNEVHAAADATARRHAVADWLYWKHLAGQLDAALADASKC
jgi:hypothetical protein